MGVLSKEYFNSSISVDTPCSILHPWSSSCLLGLSKIVLNVIIGSTKFFVPIYVLKILLNWKKISKKYVKEQLFAFLRTIVYAMLYAIILFGSTCLLINLGYYNYYTIGTTSALGGLSVLVECRENMHLDTILYFNQVVEATINRMVSNEMITRTRWNETVAFMMVSSCLMYTFKTQTTTKRIMNLWFYPVTSVRRRHLNKESEATVCKHPESCLSYSCRGGVKYFAMGYILEIIKSILPKFAIFVSSPRNVLKFLFNRKNALFGLFFGMYIAMYRAITCYLFKKDKKEVAEHALIAGFLSGSAYYLKPNIQIPIIAFTTLLQLLIQRVHEAYDLPNLPYCAILFSLCSGYLFHNRFLLMEYCPRYTRNMTNIVTNNLAQKIHLHFLKFLKASDLYRKAAPSQVLC